MSYVTVIPNYFYNANTPMGQLANQYMVSQNRFNPNTVLTCLQSALRISLTNYQQNYQQTSVPPASQPKPEASPKLTPQQPADSVELIQSPEENKPILNNHINSQQNTPKPLIVLPQEKQAKKDPLALTDDEFLLQDKEKKIKKNQLSERKGKKVKLNPVDQFVVPIPQIDRIQTAYLPTFTLNYESISKKRQDLLRRQVEQCADFMRSKKDKRQIRNLTN